MTNPELRAEWLVDVKTMADRIITMRTQLQEGLTNNGLAIFRPWLELNISCFRILPQLAAHYWPDWYVLLHRDDPGPGGGHHQGLQRLPHQGWPDLHGWHHLQECWLSGRGHARCHQVTCPVWPPTQWLARMKSYYCYSNLRYQWWHRAHWMMNILVKMIIFYK